MSKDKPKRRVINLQNQVKIARDALTRIQAGCHNPEGIAEAAIDAMWRLDPKQQLQGIVGHGQKQTGHTMAHLPRCR